MTDPEERIKALEERVQRLERQMATLLQRKKPAPARARDYRDRYDALDYPEER